jgi:hypothetical protein
MRRRRSGTTQTRNDCANNMYVMCAVVATPTAKSHNITKLKNINKECNNFDRLMVLFRLPFGVFRAGALLAHAPHDNDRPSPSSSTLV